MRQFKAFLSTVLTAVIGVALATGPSAAQQKDVEIAVVDSQTGPWAPNGMQLIRGAELAVEEINAAGGIKALGGAKIKLIIADSGARPDDAATATQRVIANNPNIVGGMGAYISSQQLAITEVSERAGIPWIVGGGSDQLVERGFKNIFSTNMMVGQVSATIVPLLEQFALASGAGKLKDVAIIAVNTPATIGVADGVEAKLKEKGVSIVAKEVFAIQLADGSVLAQRIRRARPSVILFSNALASDAKTILSSLSQVGMTPKNMPIFVYGGGVFDPEMLTLLGKDALEGLTIFSSNWPTKQAADLEARYKKKSGEPWMTFVSGYGYGHTYLFKEAIEKAGSADRAKIAEALRTIKIESGPAVLGLNGPVSFEPTGRRINAPSLLLQWQNGAPITIYPPESAVAPPLKSAQ